MFRKRQKEDLFVGRYDALPIGFGAVTSLGGVGHYCVFGKLNTFQQQLEKEEDKQRVNALIEYWNDHDLKAKHARKYNDKIVNKVFSKNSLDAPIESSARLSGMMLDYNKLVEKGVKMCIRDRIRTREMTESKSVALPLGYIPTCLYNIPIL